jgi:hypothetical protein
VTAYADFLQDRAAVARAVSQYVDKLTVHGGQRAIDLVKSRLQSSLATGDSFDRNPRPASGSDWLQNEAINRERMPLTTGASDAATDGGMLLGQAGLAGRVYPHWLGRGETYRLATASAMESPVMRAFNRYQKFWSDVWQNMATHVLTQYEIANKTIFETKAVDADTDALTTIDMQALKSAINGFTDMYDRGLIASGVAPEMAEALLRIVAQSVGVSDIQDIFDAEPKSPDEEPPDGTPPAEVTKPVNAQELLAWFKQFQPVP